MSLHAPLLHPLSSPQLWQPINRKAIEDQIELLVGILDCIDGDPDLEDDNEDSCSAYDDRLEEAYCNFGFGDGYPGDPDDAEEETDRCTAGDDWITSGNLNCGGSLREDAGAGDEDDAEWPVGWNALQWNPDLAESIHENISCC